MRLVAIVTVSNHMTMIGMQKTSVPEERKEPQMSQEDVIKMSQAYRRLAAIHKANMVMASNFDLHKRLAKVLDTVLEALGDEVI